MKFIIFCYLVIFINSAVFCNSWRIYIDADFTGAEESSEGIKKGIELALDRYLPKDIEIEIVIRNHRGNSKRSLSHLKEFYNDPKGIAIYCGLHSPPVLANLEYINEKKIVLLNPWAAATPITRTPDKDGYNWIFRLSVDDSQAGEVITNFAVDSEGYKKPLLLLEDTGWGKANELTFKKALSKRNISIPAVLWFDWQVGEIGAKKIMSDILMYGPDVIFLVANAIEGETLLKEISRSSEIIPVRSHWGITGGDIFSKLENEIKSGSLDLEFIQTSFLFTNDNLNQYQRETWGLLRDKYRGIDEYSDLKAPLGFIHAYDLTKILLEAIKNIDKDMTITEQRNSLRDELENITQPVKGLIKIYNRPFTNRGINSHEALRIDNFTMGYFNNRGVIELKE